MNHPNTHTHTHTHTHHKGTETELLEILRSVFHGRIDFWWISHIIQFRSMAVCWCSFIYDSCNDFPGKASVQVRTSRRHWSRSSDWGLKLEYQHTQREVHFVTSNLSHQKLLTRRLRGSFSQSEESRWGDCSHSADCPVRTSMQSRIPSSLSRWETSGLPLYYLIRPHTLFSWN